MPSFRAWVVAALVLVAHGVPALAQSPNDLAGSWTLNRQLSQFPQEVGFSANFLPPAGPGGGGRGGRRDAADAPLSLPRVTQTEEDARRVRFLTDEVRIGHDRLTIEVTPAAVTLTPDRGVPRTLRPGRRDDAVAIGPVTAVTNAAWEGSRLVVAYRAETGRVVRYTYTVTPGPRQLVVDIEFVEPRGGDKVRRVYDPTRPEDLAAPAAPAPGGGPLSRATAPPAGGSPFEGGAPGVPPSPGSSAPASPGPAGGAIDQRPDAALKGLSRLGVIVEGLGAEALKCGLKPDALEAAVAKRLTDAGFRVVRNTDDETYLYVNVNTVTASGSLCVSRYDVTLYSHTAAALPHTPAPVLLQVELLRKGGAPAGHGDGVTKSVLDYVDQFTTRVKGANP
jgi:hypothetical protein